MQYEDKLISIDSILENHSKQLYNLAYRICGDVFLAEDLLQESLIEIERSLPQFRKESSPYTYAYKITLNTCLKYTKKENRTEQAQAALVRLEKVSTGEGGIISDYDPADELLQNALIAEIREKCHSFITFMLTEKQRIALLLNDLFQFTYKEMSFLLDVSEDVIRSRLSRARENLRNHFEKRCSWINKDNPCKCESRTASVLQKYPSLLDKLSLRIDRPEYNRMVKDQLSKKIETVDDIIASFPFLDFKGRKTLENIIKNSK